MFEDLSRVLCLLEGILCGISNLFPFAPKSGTVAMIKTWSPSLFTKKKTKAKSRERSPNYESDFLSILIYK